MKLKYLLVVLTLLCTYSIMGAVSEIDNNLNLFDEPKANSIVDGDNGKLVGFTLESPKLQDLLKLEAKTIGSGTLPVILQYKNQIDSKQKSNLKNLVSSIKYDYSIIPASAVQVDVSNLDELASLPFVSLVEFDADTNMVLAQSTTQIGASRVWISHGVEGEGITVAILDTGIDDEHPDLQNVILEQDFTGEGNGDDQGHGTHVASTVAGSGTSSGGVNKGVAPRASLLDVKVLGKTGSGKLSDTIAGIEWSVLNGADIISMSLGAQIPCNGLDATSLASDAAVRRGVHVVVAAGNTGPIPGSVGSPGCARDVITVGAVDRLDNVAIFSSRGPTLDGRTKPDIVAPGVLIFAANSGGGYKALSGTSMATPHVSGVVALILEKKRGLSPSQVKSVLMETSKDLSEDANVQGAGRIAAYQAFTKATGIAPVKDESDESRPGGSNDEDQNNDDGNPESSKTTKEEAKEKSTDSGYIDEVNSVNQVSKGGQSFFVVNGKKNQPASGVVRVWINQETGEIDKVENLSWLGRLWLYIVEFIALIGSYFV